MVKEMCSDSGIGGNKTNHSLRATAASELFHAGVPEKVIQQRTGHLSLGGLRQYEKVTTTQQQAVCRVLSVNTNSTYDNEVSRMSLPSTSSAVSTKLTFNFSFTSCTKHTCNSCSSTANEF